MVEISPLISESYSAYLILTDWITTRPEDVSLRAELGPNIPLQYPYMTARMQSVVGPEMVVAAGRHGICSMFSRNHRDEEKQRILDANRKARLRQGDIQFQDKPVSIAPEGTLEDVVKICERVGHSVIPVMDRKSFLHGVYIYQPEKLRVLPPWTPVTDVMTPLRNGDINNGIPFLVNVEDEREIKRVLEGDKRSFIPIIDQNGILHRLAFLQKYDTNFIGTAISTKDEGWKKDLEKWGSQVDTLCIDSSNACFPDAIRILKYVKDSREFKDKPFGIGNIIRGKHFTEFAEAGADYIIGGMGVGSICQTGSPETGRGNGRGQMTVARELADARDEFAKRPKGRYVYLILDGSLETVHSIEVALTHGDLLMMGNYFNRFFEAAGQKFNRDEKPTTEETQFDSVESWGEGHPRAGLVSMYGMDWRRQLSNNSPQPDKSLERYGYSSVAGATVEGVVTLVPYRGRLKPCLERDGRSIRATISNTGASDLKSYREMAVLEKMDAGTLKDMLPHGYKKILEMK